MKPRLQEVYTSTEGNQLKSGSFHSFRKHGNANLEVDKGVGFTKEWYLTGMAYFQLETCLLKKKNNTLISLIRSFVMI